MSLTTTEATATFVVAPPLPRDDACSVDVLVREHWQWALSVASRVHRTLPPTVPLDDVHADAVVGLWEAARRYDPSTGVPFRNYAGTRVRGAVVDGLRERDTRSRSHNDKHRAWRDMTDQFYITHHRTPTLEEALALLQWTRSEWDTFHRHRGAPVSLDAPTFTDGTTTIADTVTDITAIADDVDQAVDRGALLSAMTLTLTDSEYMVMLHDYFHPHPRPQPHIALGVTRGRISQLRRSALTTLRPPLVTDTPTAPDDPWRWDTDGTLHVTTPHDIPSPPHPQAVAVIHTRFPSGTGWRAVHALQQAGWTRIHVHTPTLTPAAVTAALHLNVTALLPGTLTRPNLAPAPRRDTTLNDNPLSYRELEVIAAIASGHTNITAAATLGLQPHTIKSHLQRIMARTGIHDRAHLIAHALRANIITYNPTTHTYTPT